jgi:hypothetical protein
MKRESVAPEIASRGRSPPCGRERRSSVEAEEASLCGRARSGGDEAVVGGGESRGLRRSHACPPHSAPASLGVELVVSSSCPGGSASAGGGEGKDEVASERGGGGGGGKGARMKSARESGSRGGGSREGDE